jgi:hypothetical protein
LAGPGCGTAGRDPARTPRRYIGWGSHRDCAANILLAGDGTPRLADSAGQMMDMSRA